MCAFCALGLSINHTRGLACTFASLSSPSEPLHTLVSACRLRPPPNADARTQRAQPWVNHEIGSLEKTATPRLGLSWSLSVDPSVKIEKQNRRASILRMSTRQSLRQSIFPFAFLYKCFHPQFCSPKHVPLPPAPPHVLQLLQDRSRRHSSCTATATLAIGGQDLVDLKTRETIT